LAALGLAAALGAWQLGNRASDVEPPSPRKMTVDIGADASLSLTMGASAVLSPDGKVLAFTAARSGPQQLYVRRLDQLQAILLPGTEGAMSPFFSPKGDWIGFFTSSQLKKVAVTGGAAVPLCDATNGRGGTWLADDTILFTPNSTIDVRLLRVAAAGGQPQDFGAFIEKGRSQRWPQALPNGTHVLYTENTGISGWDNAYIVVAPIAGGPPTLLIRTGYYARYVAPAARSGSSAPGHIIYLQQGTVFAVPFDINTLKITGPQFPAFEGVSTNSATGGGQYDVSPDGTLVFIPGIASSSLSGPVMWMTKEGKTSTLRAAPSQWSEPRFSPTGDRLAMAISDGKQREIWVYEPSRGTATQLTFDPATDRTPVWSPGGTRIVFSSDREKPGGPTNIYMTNADGTGAVTRLTNSPNTQVASSWHPTGRFLFFQQQRPDTGFDLMVLPLEGDEKQGWKPGQPTVFLSTPDLEVYARISPDGRWLSYFSSVSGGPINVFVRPFPGPGGMWKVSSEAGGFAQWSEKTHELLFVNPTTNRIMTAPYTVVGDSFRPDTPRPWSPIPYQLMGLLDPYTVHPDGQRIAVSVAENQSSTLNNRVVFFLNFADYLRGLTK
jgi:Tol biopolymer transport system component